MNIKYTIINQTPYDFELVQSISGTIEPVTVTVTTSSDSDSEADNPPDINQAWSGRWDPGQDGTNVFSKTLGFVFKTPGEYGRIVFVIHGNLFDLLKCEKTARIGLVKDTAPEITEQRQNALRDRTDMFTDGNGMPYRSLKTCTWPRADRIQYLIRARVIEKDPGIIEFVFVITGEKMDINDAPSDESGGQVLWHPDHVYPCERA